MSSSSKTASPVSAPSQEKTPAQCKVAGEKLWMKMQDSRKDANTKEALKCAKAKDEEDLQIFDQRFYWACRTQEARRTPNGQAYTVNMMNAQPKTVSGGTPPAFHNGISTNGQILHAFSNDKQGTQQPCWSMLINALLGLYGGLRMELSAMNPENLGFVREIVREQISNKTWLNAAKAVASERGLADTNTWFELRPTDVKKHDFFTMLGTPNGAGVAWLLIDYAAKFRGATIDHIKVNHGAKEMRIILR